VVGKPVEEVLLAAETRVFADLAPDRLEGSSGACAPVPSQRLWPPQERYDRSPIAVIVPATAGSQCEPWFGNTAKPTLNVA
jgi:hypothetical protein